MTMNAAVSAESVADRIAARIAALAANRSRTVVALAGPPAAGKSTVSEALEAALVARGLSAAIVPMDGFHYDNAILDRHGWRARKGAPHTFDAGGYRALIERLVANSLDDVAVPVFDRAADLSRGSARIVAGGTRVIIAEGNYLLLDRAPWSALRALFDFSVLLEAPMATIEGRILERWHGFGFDAAEARRRAEENDLPNARLVVERSAGADLTVSTE